MSEFVFGVDLDGVCADYKNGIRRLLAEKRKIDISELPERVSWNFTEWGITHDEYQALHTEAVIRRRLFATLDVVEGCAEALWRLSDAGVWIRVITHRLFLNHGHAIAVTDTCTWLDARNIPYRDICFLGDKPQVGADVYIDDAPHNVEALRAGGADVIVFSQSYNEDVAGPRANSWAEVEEYVMERFDRHQASLSR